MILDLFHDERLDESERLVLTVPLDDPKAYLLDSPDRELEWQGRAFYVAEITDNRDGSEPTRTVEAWARWYRLGDSTYVGSFVLDDVTTRAGLEQILAGTGWTVAGSTTLSASTFSLEAQDKSRLALVREWAKVTGTYVVWDSLGRKVALTTTRGADRGLSFRYGRNLRSVRRRRRPPEATVLYPYGANGLTIAGVNSGAEYLEDFTYYTDQGMTEGEARAAFTRSRVWSDSSFLVDTDLKAAGVALLAELAAGAVTYECSVVDLTEVLGFSEVVEIADTVRAVDPELGEVTTIVVRRQHFPLEPWRDRVELGTLQQTDTTSDSTYRDPLSESWTMFVGDLGAALKIRNDGVFIGGRIPLRFRTGGRAHWHADVIATGVGAGTLFVDVYDATSGQTIRGPISTPYTDGASVHLSLQFAEVDRSGSYDYRCRVWTEADGGPSTTAGVDLAIADLRFFVLAIGAVQETPTLPDSETFDYTGAVQHFTVPDGVTELTITAIGAAGGLSTTYAGTRAGGGSVTAAFAVTPGAVLDVYVGGCPGSAQAGGWPNGGDGDAVSGSIGTGGGGSSHVVASGGSIGSAMIVAAGGGGQGNGFSTYAQNGGAGGLFEGADAASGSPAGGLCPGGGATMYAGGAGGTGTEANGDAGTLGAGGDGGNMTNAFGFPPGGGGGGYYGGGGGGANTGAGAGTGGGGGGGAGFVAVGAWDIEADDGASTGDGQVVISWTNPET